MDIRLLPEINGPGNVWEVKLSAQIGGRRCYSKRSIQALLDEDYNSGLIENRLLPSGHHSPFEHKHLSFHMQVPKILAMALNNERPYVTSEKSARYTIMEDIVSEQQVLYHKWFKILVEEISENYPEQKFPKMYVKDKTSKTPIEKLAQENARYMTSVFTPTSMVHTLDGRQLNFILNEFKKYHEAKFDSDNVFERRFAALLPEFIERMSRFKIEGLVNQTDRHLSLFRETPVEEYFGDVYATNYRISFASLGQAQRHRTLTYTMKTPKIEAEDASFFIPEIVKRAGLVGEWLRDMSTVAKEDFPQGQLVIATERGNIEDFRSKCLLRLCSQVQYELMINTMRVAGKYAQVRPEVLDWIKPKCQQGIRCAEPCIIGSGLALDRIV